MAKLRNLRNPQNLAPYNSTEGKNPRLLSKCFGIGSIFVCLIPHILLKIILHQHINYVRIR